MAFWPGTLLPAASCPQGSITCLVCVQRGFAPPFSLPTLPLPAQTGASFEYVLHLSREFRGTPTAKLITSTMSANNEQFYLRY